MKAKTQRLIFVVCGVLCIAVAVTLVLRSFNNNLVFFFSPSEIKEKNSKKTIRIGGLVEKGSVQKQGLITRFIITDFKEQVHVEYHGLLPNLFRDNQGVVAKGVFANDNVFIASELLAKHDEKYMPPEVKKAIGMK